MHGGITNNAMEMRCVSYIEMNKMDQKCWRNKGMWEHSGRFQKDLKKPCEFENIEVEKNGQVKQHLDTDNKRISALEDRFENGTVKSTQRKGLENMRSEGGTEKRKKRSNLCKWCYRKREQNELVNFSIQRGHGWEYHRLVKDMNI